MSELHFKIRGQDPHGAGHFGAPRGSRTHNGVDIVCGSTDIIQSRTPGEVTKIGYPYAPHDKKKGHCRYVEVTLDGNRFRYFYLYPGVEKGDLVQPGDSLGIAQDLDQIYPGITQHFHFEIIRPDGSYQDPTTMFEDICS